MSDAISKAIGALEYAATMLDEDRYPGRITEAISFLQAMQGETYRFHCTNCGWKGDCLMAHKSLCSALYMEHYPPQPAVPEGISASEMLDRLSALEDQAPTMSGMGMYTQMRQLLPSKSELSAAKGEES